MTHPVRAVAISDYCPELVALNKAAIEALPRNIEVAPIAPALSGDSPLSKSASLYVPYLVVMNSLNFQFWAKQDAGVLDRYAYEGVPGALGMQKAFEKAWLAELGDGTEGLRPVSALAERIQREGVAFIFGAIPASAARQDILLEVLNPELLKKVCGLLRERLSAGRLDIESATLLAQEFPVAYADRYLKKAQLTLIFLGAQYNASPEFSSALACRLDVTACADYQLPKVMRSLGILDYAPALADVVDNERLIATDSMEERAIRAATVLGCDALAAHFGASIEAVDFWLWVMRNQSRTAKFHLTETTCY